MQAIRYRTWFARAPKGTDHVYENHEDPGRRARSGIVFNRVDRNRECRPGRAPISDEPGAVLDGTRVAHDRRRCAVMRVERISAIRSRTETVGSLRPSLMRQMTMTPCTVRKKETSKHSIDWQENRHDAAILHLNHVLSDRLFNGRRSRDLRGDRAMRSGGSHKRHGGIGSAARPGQQAGLLDPRTLGRMVSLRRRRAITS